MNDVHGMQLLFSQEGSFFVFDFPTLMLALISGFALFASAKSLADAFLMYAAPKRADYQLFVQSTTPDFSPDGPVEEAVLQQVLERKRWKQALIMARSGGKEAAAIIL